MKTNQYERLLALAMEKLEQIETENSWLKFENQRLKEQINEGGNND